MTSKIPQYRELRITETDGGVEVDFFPDLYVVPVVEKEPTESNPDVKLDLGKIGGNLAPLKAYYPPGTTAEEIMDKVDILFEKIEWCPSCERKKREVIAKLQKFMEKRGQSDVFQRMMERAQQKSEEKKPQPIEHKQYKMEQEATATRKKPLEQRMMENVEGAIDNAYVAVRGFFVPPVPPVRFDEWVKKASGG